MAQTWVTTITNIQPIPNKDRIALATVNGYQAIVGADTYSVGDRVLYISEGSILPETLQEELGLVGRLAGSAKNRVKAIKMGGVISQGIICQPIQWSASLLNGTDATDDFDELLGITKHDPQIPVHLSGKVGRPKGDAPIAPMYDIENIKKMRHWREEYDSRGNVIRGNWYDPFTDQPVIITEKLHGTNFAFHINADDPDTVYIYSKGLGKNGHVLLEDDTNTYWRAYHMYPQLKEFARTECADSPNVKAVTIRGEIIGAGIQDLTYGISFDLALFSVETHFVNGATYSFHPFHYGELDGVPQIPILYQGKYSYGQACEMAEGSNLYGTPGIHVREGVVVAHAYQYRQMNGSRYAAKFINPEYLVRKGGTEYN